MQHIVFAVAWQITQIWAYTVCVTQGICTNVDSLLKSAFTHVFVSHTSSAKQSRSLKPELTHFVTHGICNTRDRLLISVRTHVLVQHMSFAKAGQVTQIWIYTFCVTHGICNNRRRLLKSVCTHVLCNTFHLQSKASYLNQSLHILLRSLPPRGTLAS